MSNIKLTNGVLVDQDSISGSKGVNGANILVNTRNGNNLSWTATTDAFVVFAKGGSYGSVLIDDWNMTGSINNGGFSGDYIYSMPIRKGGKIAINGSAAYLIILGLK